MASIKVADLFARVGFKVDDKDLKKFDDTIKKTKKDVDGFSTSLKRAAGFVGSFLGAFALKSLFDAGRDIESIENSLRAATGSTKAARKEFEFINAEADRLGLNVRVSAREFSKLAAAAKGTKLEGQGARDVFTAVSEASVVLGLRADETRGALTAVQQIISKGKVSAEELRGQLGERLPGAFQIAARSMGKTTQELDKMLVKGELLAEDFLPKFAEQLSKEYAGSLGEASKSTQANLNRLQTAFFRFQVQIARSGFLDVVTEILIGLTEVLKSLAPVGRVIGKTFKVAGAALKAFLRLLRPIFRAFQELPFPVQIATLAVLGLAAAFTKAGRAVLVFLRRFLLVPALIAGIALIAEDLLVAIQGGDSAFAKWAESENPLVNFLASVALGFGEILNVVGQFIGFLLAGAPGGFAAFDKAARKSLKKLKKLFGDEIKAIKKFFKDLFDSLPRGVQFALQKVGSIFSSLWQATRSFLGAIAGLIDAIINLVKGNFAEAWESLKATVSLVWEGIKSIIEAGLNVIRSLFSFFGVDIDQVFRDIKDFFVKMIDKMREVVKNFIKSVKGFFLEIKQFFIDLGKSISDFFTGIFNSIKSGFDKVKSFIPGLGDDEEEQQQQSPGGAPAGLLIGRAALAAYRHREDIAKFIPEAKNVLKTLSIGSITNEITVPEGTTSEQGSAITSQVNDAMQGFFDSILLSAQSEVPEAS